MRAASPSLFYTLVARAGQSASRDLAAIKASTKCRRADIVAFRVEAYSTGQ
jgi:hypothetical protein